MGFATVIGQALFIIIFILLFAQMFVMQHKQSQLQTELFAYQQKQLALEQSTKIEFVETAYSSQWHTIHAELVNTGTTSIPFNTSDFYISTLKIARTQTTRNSFACAYSAQQCGEIGFSNGTNGETTDLRMLYHFDNDSEYGESAAKATDFAAQANNLSLSGVTLQNCLFDRCLNFEGSGQAAMPASATNAFDNTSSYTWSFWLNPSNLAGVTEQTIISKASVASGYTLFLDVDNNIKLQNPNGGQVFSCPSQLAIGTWTHVAIVYTPSQIRCYQNGASVANITIGTAFNSDSTADFIIGADNLLSYGNLNASLDEVAIYNASKTDSQILALYRHGVYVQSKQSLDPGERLAVNIYEPMSTSIVPVTYATAIGSTATSLVNVQ